MITALKLSNNKFQVITANDAKHIASKNIYQSVFEEDCIINGVVTNEAAFKKQISEFWAANALPKKDVVLVINSSQMVIKMLSLPTQKENKMLEMIAREYPESEKTEPQLYDYTLLSENKETNFSELLCVMAPTSLIEGYTNIFKDMNITLSGVIPVQSGAVEALSELEGMKNETAIVQLFDTNTLISLLWVNGKYAYAQRTRLFNEAGSSDFTTEISGNISSMLQFYSTLHNDQPLEHVYICGLSEQALTDCTEAVTQLGLTSSYLSDKGGASESGSLLNSTIAASGAFVKNKHSMNLLESYKKQSAGAKEKNKLVTKYLPLGIVVGAVLVVLLGLFITNLIMNASLAKRKAYLNDPNNLSQSVEADKVINENTELRSQIGALSAASQAQQSYPKMNSKVITAIEQAGGGVVSMNISSYYSQTGQLTIAAQTASVEQINSYIDRLKATNLFDKVEYSGYTFTQNTNSYTINVICYLNSEAGK